MADKLFNKNFLLLFQGQLVSQIGSSIYIVALVFWVKHATDSATLVGLLSMVAMIPGVLLGPLGGTIADHFSRKKIIVLGDLLNGILLCTIAAIMFTKPDATDLILTLLFIEAVVGGTIMAAFRPAVSAAIPDIVPAKRIDAANGMIQSSFQIAMLIGQSVGGLLYRVLGAPVVMLIDGLTYLFSAASESFITIPQKTGEAVSGWSEAIQKMKSDTVEGFRFVVASRGLVDMMFVMAAITFFIAPFGVLLAFFVEDTLGATPDWYGYIIAGMAFGTILGSIAAGVLQVSPRKKGRAVIILLLLLALGFVAFAYSPSAQVALFILMAVGIFSGMINVIIAGVLQLSTPSEIRGRVFGLLGTLSAGLAPISLGLAGVIADAIDRNISLMYVVSGVAMALCLPYLAFSKPFHALMAYEEEPAEQAEEAEPESPAD